MRRLCGIRSSKVERSRDKGDRCERAKNGFSVTEILIALVIVSVIAVIAIPVTLRQIQAHRLDSSASLVASKISEARMNAIKRNRSATLLLSLSQRNAQVTSTDASNTAVDVGHPMRFYGNVALDAADSVSLTFDSMGRLSGGAQTVTLVDHDSGKRKDIVVSPAGRINLSGAYAPVAF